MSKTSRAAALAVVACFLSPVAMAAQDDSTTVDVGQDGNVKVKSGGRTVKVNGGGSSVQVHGGGANVQVHDTGTGAHSDDSDSDDDSDSGSGDIDITDSGLTKTYDCGKGAAVEITGSDNTVTLTGECKEIDVTGSSNKVKAEAAGKIDVTGSGNTVTWKRGLGTAKKPKVSQTGMNNKVSKAP